jgi:hypothetical protein
LHSGRRDTSWKRNKKRYTLTRKYNGKKMSGEKWILKGDANNSFSII